MGLLAFLLSFILAILYDYSVLQSVVMSYAIAALIFFIAVIKFTWTRKSFDAKEEAFDWGMYSRRHNMLRREHDRNDHAPRAEEQTALERNMSINNLADRAFTHWSQLNSDQSIVSGARVFFASTKNSATLDDLKSELARSGHDIDMCNDLDEVMSCITEAPDEWKYLFVDIDALEEVTLIEDIIDFLICFRNEVPHMPIALVSEYFDKDDLGTTRIHATDISLRAPVSKGRAKRALSMMTINNKLWQAQGDDPANERKSKQGVASST